jgi:putative pyrimidine permease RutG
MFLIAPVAIILVAENLGHIKAIGAMTGRSPDRFLGRAFLGDSLATIVLMWPRFSATRMMPRTSG